MYRLQSIHNSWSAVSPYHYTIGYSRQNGFEIDLFQYSKKKFRHSFNPKHHGSPSLSLREYILPTGC